MAVGLYCFPVGVKLEQQSGSGSAYSCAVACDEGRCYAEQINVANYENGTVTVTSTSSGAIKSLDDATPCDDIDVSDDFDPGFDYGEYEGSDPPTYNNEISADAVISVAIASVTFGSILEDESWYGTTASWADAGLAVSAVTTATGDGGSATCGKTRFRLTRLPGMAGIGVTARWKVRLTDGGTEVGEGSAALDVAGASSGWIEVDSGSYIDHVTFDIGPYA